MSFLSKILARGAKEAPLLERTVEESRPVSQVTKRLRAGKVVHPSFISREVRDIPELAEGHIRLWRGEKLDPTTGGYIPLDQYLSNRAYNEERAATAGRWYHGPTNLADPSDEGSFQKALDYADIKNFSDKPGLVRYVDIPVEQARSMYTPNMSQDYIKSVRAGASAIPGEYMVDPEVAKRSLPVQTIVSNYPFNANEQTLYMMNRLSQIEGYESIAGLEHANPFDRHATLQELYGKSKVQSMTAQEKLWEARNLEDEDKLRRRRLPTGHEGKADPGDFPARVAQAEEEFKNANRPMRFLNQIRDSEEMEIQSKVSITRKTKQISPRTRRRARANQQVLSQLAFRRR